MNLGATVVAKQQKVDSKDLEIKALKRKNSAQERMIAKLQDDILAMKNKTAVPSTSLGAQRIGNSTYELMGSGPNPGKLASQEWIKVRVDGITYKEWAILSEVSLNMGNTQRMTEKTHMMDGIFTKIPDGKNKGKWLSEHTEVETKEGVYIKWLVREEVIEEGDFIL